MSQKSTAKRILYLVPAPMSRGPFGASELTRRQRLLNERAWGGFRFEVRDTDEGPFTIESIVDEQLSVPGTLRAAVQAEHNGFSAIVLGCFADPGSDAARALLRIPVVGPAEVSLHLACQLGNRYAILTTSEGVVPLIEKVVRHLADDRKAMLNRLERAGRLALDTDGADVLVLGCMSVSFLNVAPDLSRRLGVPVVCPLAAAVEFAQSLVRCGLSHSKKAFPVPAQSVSAAAGQRSRAGRTT